MADSDRTMPAEPRLLVRSMVHPWLCDLYGHLTTRQYAALFADANDHLLMQVFGYAPNVTGSEHRGWVDVKHEITYVREMRLGALLEIDGYVQKLGRKSVTLRCEMRELPNGAVAAFQSSVTVYFDLQSRQSLEIPEDLRMRVVSNDARSLPAR